MSNLYAHTTAGVKTKKGRVAEHWADRDQTSRASRVECCELAKALIDNDWGNALQTGIENRPILQL